MDRANRLYYGDNLDVLRQHVGDASVDLIYLDPPFNSNRSYNVLFRHSSGAESQAQIEAFDDTWTWSQESEWVYRTLLNGGVPPRVADAIEAMRRLLGENDVLAYLVMMAARLVELTGYSGLPARSISISTRRQVIISRSCSTRSSGRSASLMRFYGSVAVLIATANKEPSTTAGYTAPSCSTPRVRSAHSVSNTPNTTRSTLTRITAGSRKTPAGATG